MTEAPPEKIDLNSESSWNTSRRFASVLFPIPPVIISAMQNLWTDHLTAKETGSVKVRMTTLQALKMIDRSSKLKLPIYFAATELFPDQVATITEDDTTKALVDILGPGLFATFLGMVYLHRRLKKICTDEQWLLLSKEMVINMELGYLIGSSVPKLGAAEGTLAGGMRYAALAPYLIMTPDPFKRYRNAKKRQFDIQHEHTTWGCDHTQICAYILKEMCFSPDLLKNSHAFRKLDNNELCTLDGELDSWRSALRFIDEVKANADLAASAVKLALTAEELISLKTKTDALFKGKTSFAWMFKSTGPDEPAEEQK